MSDKDWQDAILLDRIPLSGKLPYKRVKKMEFNQVKELLKPCDQRLDTSFLEAMSKLILDDTERMMKEVRKKIWDYMAEHPTEDNGVIISPSTHNLIVEEYDYHTDENHAQWFYAKKFYFKRKDCVVWDDCNEMIDKYEKQYE